jgi:hypothetical protein
VNPHSLSRSYLIMFLVASLAFWSEPLFGSFQLEKISVECDGNTTLALIQTDGVVAFKHFELGDQVFRVVVDLPETVNPAGIAEYGEFPCSSLVAIRTSQFSKKPLVARVVFDFAQQIEWGVKQQGEKLSLSFSTPGEQRFPSMTVFQAEATIETKKGPEPTALASVQKETRGAEKTPEVAKVTTEKGSASPPPMRQVKKEEILPQREKIETKGEPEPKALPSVQKENPGIEKTPESTEVTIEKASASPPRVKEVKKEEILPQREKVEYTPKNPRDPFASLIGKEKPVGFVLSNLPRGENLNLVGIVDEGPHFKALCEDQFGTGYILGENDRLEDGYVASVEPDRAVFIIEQYGWSRQRLLELPTSGR